ncbi:hypothetical protein, partial [Eubacterium callanderi]
RLRSERERLRLSQRAFGQLGGVEANAEGKYESGKRMPKADYLAAITNHGVDILFVLTGTNTPISADSLNQVEKKILVSFRTFGHGQPVSCAS